jgi:hypothetical protein
MRYLVTCEASKDAGDRLDTQPGGPGPFFAQVAERFRPEAFYVAADRRAVFWIMDLPDAAAITELMHLTLAKAGSYPVLQPVLTGDEARTAVPAAIEKARR